MVEITATAIPPTLTATSTPCVPEIQTIPFMDVVNRCIDVSDSNNPSLPSVTFAPSSSVQNKLPTTEEQAQNAIKTVVAAIPTIPPRSPTSTPTNNRILELTKTAQALAIPQTPPGTIIGYVMEGSTKIATVSTRATEKNSTWWRYAWQTSLENQGSRSLTLSIEVKWLDRDGFVIETDRMYNVTLGAGESRTFTDFQFIDTSVAGNVRSVVAELF